MRKKRRHHAKNSNNMAPQNAENISKEQVRSFRGEGDGRPPFCCGKNFVKIFIISELLWSCLPQSLFCDHIKNEEKVRK